MPTDADTRRERALRSISVMADGNLDDFEEVLHPEFLNHERKDEPPPRAGSARQAPTQPRYGCATPSPTCAGENRPALQER
jgi:hypothetical protein